MGLRSVLFVTIWCSYALTAVVVVVLGLGTTALADVLDMGPGLTSLETVRVGDPGNAMDT